MISDAKLISYLKKEVRAEHAAILASIRKWEGIVKGRGIDKGDENCALCKYADKQATTAGADCYVCPVGRKKLTTGCRGTPYAEWFDHHIKADHPWINGWKVSCPTCLKIAKAEVKFLKSLLPRRKRVTTKTADAE